MATINESIIQAKQIADNMDNNLLKSIIVDLQSAILDLQQENLNLREKCSTQDSFNMQFKDDMYYNQKNDNTLDGPYCSACYDNKSKAIRMNTITTGCYGCPVCKNTIYTDKFETPSPVYLGSAL